MIKKKISLLLVASILASLIYFPSAGGTVYSAENNTPVAAKMLKDAFSAENEAKAVSNLKQQEKDSNLYTSISGTISLPEGLTAESGSITVNIAAQPKETNSYYNTSVTIPEKGTSAIYLLRIPTVDASKEYHIRYDILSDNLTAKSCIKSGYYSKDGTVGDYKSATNLNTGNGNIEGINLPILKKANNQAGTTIYTPEEYTTISGTVSLPGGAVAPSGGLNVNVSANIRNDLYSYYGTNIKIPANSNATSYTLSLPQNSYRENYIVKYSLDDGQDYVRYGYYKASGTTAYSNSATSVDVSINSAYGINMTVLTGNKISGTINLPGGETAPPEGLNAVVLILGKDSGGYTDDTFVQIPQGHNSAPYSVTVPPNTVGSGYYAAYILNNYYGEEYVDSGFCYYKNATTTSVNHNSAALIDVGIGNVAGINITLLLNNFISGSISLPNGQVAPIGGMSLNIDASGSYYYRNVYVTIPYGSNSTSYSIPVAPNDADWRYRVYYLYDSSEYINLGYYGLNGTTTDYYQATQIDASGSNPSGINMVILTGKKISGTISLPSGHYAPQGGMWVTIKADNGRGYYTVIMIPQNANYANYILSVPPNQTGLGYSISYILWDYEGDEYIERGYYSTGGTVTSNKDATPLYVSSSDATAINMTVITSKRISGTVSLPGTSVAPSGGIEVNVSGCIRDDLYTYADTDITIPQGSNSANYTLLVAPNALGEGYDIEYWIDNYEGLDYAKGGYYSTGGTTVFLNSATPVDVSSSDKNSINLYIQPVSALPTDDHSNNISGATNVAGNVYSEGVIDYIGDIDYFKFTPSISTTYVISSFSSIDTYGYLLNSSGTVIAFNDDNGSSGNFSITYNLTSGQDYYIKVRDYRDDTGQYTLCIQPTEDSSFSLYVNNVLIPTDAPILLVGNEPYVPIRAIAEGLGLTVMWDAQLQKITFLSAQTRLDMNIGNTSCLINGISYPLQNPPMIVNARTYTGISIVAEAFGYLTIIDYITKTISLSNAPTPTPATIEGYANIFLGGENTGLNSLILGNLSQSAINSTFSNLEITLKRNSSDTGKVYNGSDVFIPDANGNFAVRDGTNKVTGKFRLTTSDLTNTIIRIDGVGYLSFEAAITLTAGQIFTVGSLSSPVKLYPGDLGSLNGGLTTEPDGKIDNIDFSVWLKIYKDALADTASSENKLKADLSKDGVIDNIDFSLWLASYKKVLAQ